MSKLAAAPRSRLGRGTPVLNTTSCGCTRDSTRLSVFPATSTKLALRCTCLRACSARIVGQTFEGQTPKRCGPMVLPTPLSGGLATRRAYHWMVGQAIGRASNHRFCGGTSGRCMGLPAQHIASKTAELSHLTWVAHGAAKSGEPHGFVSTCSAPMIGRFGHRAAAGWSDG